MGYAAQYDRWLVNEDQELGEISTLNIKDNASKVGRFFQEQPPEAIEVAPHFLRLGPRRDVLLFGAGAVTALVGGGALLPQATLERLGEVNGNKTWTRKERLPNKPLRSD